MATLKQLKAQSKSRLNSNKRTKVRKKTVKREASGNALNLLRVTKKRRRNTGRDGGR